MDYNLFGQSDDLSDPAEGLYFVSEGSYPFAFFLKWSTSNGATNQDWYVK